MKTIDLLNIQINSGSIHMDGNFFLDVIESREKAVNVQYLGKNHWVPKSVFQHRCSGDLVVFGIKEWFVNKNIMSKF